MSAPSNWEERRYKRQRFAEEVVIPMDVLPDPEGLAFWSYWQHECAAFGLNLRLLASRPEGKVATHEKSCRPCQIL